MAGQLNLGTSCGNLIYDLSKREDVKTIVEIGTWNGEGSTMCVIQSLIDSKNKKEFISLEMYPEMYEKAKLFLSEYKDYVTLLNGRIIDYEDSFWFDHNLVDLTHDEHARLYFKKDLDYLKTTANVFENLPEKIDLLILDGGEYTTYPEWVKLKDRTKIVFLDDSNILKCKRIRQEILDSGNYKTLYDNLNDRNGVSSFEKII
jgi:hypothetical protein